MAGPTHAQYPGGGGGYPGGGGGYPGSGWQPIPCNADSSTPVKNPAALYDQSGFLFLQGTETGSETDSYPTVMKNAAAANLNAYGFYLNALAPSPILNPILNSGNPFPATVAEEGPGIGMDGSAIIHAYNWAYNGQTWGYYYVGQSSGPPLVGNILGSLSAGFDGQVLAYYKWQWQGGGTPSSPAPDHMDLLLKTTLTARAAASFLLDGEGTSSTATATDQVFNETATATASLSNQSPSQTFQGFHLVRAAVGGNGVAEVYLNGQTEATVSSLLPDGQWMNYPGGEPSGQYYQPTNGQLYATAGAYVGGAVRPDNREVIITSGIETSYHKGSAVTDNGWPQPVVNVRGPDGSIAVDSIVQWENAEPGDIDTPPITQGWQVDNFPFTADAANFQFPSYVWSLQGPGSLEHSMDLPNVTDLTFVDPNGKDFPLKSNLTVKVTDSDGAVGSNTYAVTWHLPAENWQLTGPPQALPPSIYAASTDQSPVNLPASCTIQQQQVDFSVAGQTAGGILSTVGAVVAFTQPETDPLIIAFLTGSGYTLGLVQPPSPSTIPATGTTANFTADVGTQEAINAGNTSGIFLPNVPRMSPSLANQLTASGNYAGYASGSAGGSLTYTATYYRLQWLQNYTGDEYNVHGFVGDVPASVQFPGGGANGGAPVFTWTWTPNPGPGA